MGKGAILVTGASGALGQRVTLDLVSTGHEVLAVARREEDVRQRLAAAGAALDVAPSADAGLARPLGFDVGSRDGWKEARARSTWPALSGAVLTAGGYRGGTPLHETSDETWELLVHMNLDTARVSLVELLPELIANGGGSIVLVGSRSGVRPWEARGSAAYAATKAALSSLVQTVAEEALDHGVRVNAVLPSTMDTQDNRRAMPQADASRWVDTGSVSSVIQFLLSDAARDVSGALVPVYGRA